MIKSVVTIIRPVNVVISMMSVYLGGIISVDRYYDGYLILACLSAGLIAGFGNVCNDIFDLKIDSKSKPFRPLPSGQMSVKEAIIIAFMLALIGLVLSVFINMICLIIASIWAIGLLFYTPVFKGRGYSGNLLISLLSALAFFYGAAAVGNIYGGMIPAVFAFMFHFIREIVKDMEDYEADMACDVKTGVVRYGFAVSRVIAGVTISALIIATLMPYILGIYNIGYLIAVVLGTDIFLVYFILRLLKKPDNKTYRFIAGFMKAVMPLGILAVFVGSRGW